MGRRFSQVLAALLVITVALALASAARPVIKGSMPRELVERVVERHRDEVDACYARGLKRRPGLAGTVKVEFIIKAIGTVMHAEVIESTLGDRPVEQCIVKAVKSWKFPSAKCGGISIVTYPFELQPGN